MIAMRFIKTNQSKWDVIQWANMCMWTHARFTQHLVIAHTNDMYVLF